MSRYSRKLRSTNLRSRTETTFVQSPELAQRNAQRPQLTPTVRSTSPLLVNTPKENR